MFEIKSFWVHWDYDVYGCPGLFQPSQILYFHIVTPPSTSGAIINSILEFLPHDSLLVNALEFPNL